LLALNESSFGALRKAQRILDRTHVDSDDEEESDGSSSTEGQQLDDTTDEESKPEDEVRVKGPKKAATIAARKSKHAPTESTSKRPVSRHRTVVEMKKMEVRDPRFSQLSGEFDANKFQNQYNFLPDIRQGELATLRDSLKRARKLLTSSPRHLRPEREAEAERLALAVKRAESSVNRDKRERVERDALTAVTKEERNKRQTGKKAFWLKNAEKKKLLLKARYDAVAAEGGKKAVKKVIEKKRRKQSQKETKSRPFSRVTESASTPMPQQSRKRKVSGDHDGPARKHPKSA
jgi:ribosomal RNA-processing protein 36